MNSRLSLHTRLTLLISVAVATAVAACAAAAWFITRDQLFRQLDVSIAAQPVPSDFVNLLAHNCHPNPAASTGNLPPLLLTTQLELPDGVRCAEDGQMAVVVSPSDIQVAQGERRFVFRDGVTDAGDPVRVYTRPVPGMHLAVTIARPLDETAQSLTNLAVLLAVVTAVGAVGAASMGLGISRAALKPVGRLTDIVEHIARTEDLNTQIPVEGDDEIARLGRSFNSMTSALAKSRERQQRLVADAGHELRTPLTSLRTNIELLLRSETTGRALPPERRRKLLVSLKAQLTELSSLVGDLLELSRPTETRRDTPGEMIALHEIAEHAVARARLRGPDLRFEVELHPWYVRGHPSSLERAVVNLLDNAVKFSPTSGTIEVRLQSGRLTITDQGPGIPPEELPYVFDRFWRSPSARSLPGSGLGLAIVAHAIREAEGEVRLGPADGGGTVATICLPGSPTRPTS